MARKKLMEMNKEKYSTLLKRFALEISEVGVSDELVSLVRDKTNTHPNTSAAAGEETTDRFEYRYQGYSITAVRTVKLSVQKVK